MMKVVENAKKEGRKVLSEYESKQVLAAYRIPVTREVLVNRIQDLSKAVEKIGFPLVMKGCSSKIAHKTEKGLIRIDIRSIDEAKSAFRNIVEQMDGDEKSVLIQEMVKGQRELVVGMTRDAQFGPSVMFGLGGIFTEILRDVSFRIAPLTKLDALEMMHEIKGYRILEGVRGMEPVDLESLADILIGVGKIGLENDAIREIDINPIIVSGKKPVAVDALVVL